MGWFKWKPKFGDALYDPYNGVSFLVPCSPTEAIGLFEGYATAYEDSIGELGYRIRKYLEAYGNQFGIQASAPVAGGVYAEVVDPSGIRIRAGNRVNTFWTLDITLSASGTSTRVDAIWRLPEGVEDPYDERTRWIGNVINIFGSIRGAVKQSGGQIIKK